MYPYCFCSVTPGKVSQHDEEEKTHPISLLPSEKGTNLCEFVKLLFLGSSKPSKTINKMRTKQASPWMLCEASAEVGSAA